MRERLFIQFGALPGGLVAWAATDAAGEVAGIGRGPLAELQPPRSGMQVIVLIPSDRVLLTAAQVPTRNRQRVMTALPYALEEQLASDVDTLHFAIGRWREDGAVTTAVVDRQWLEQTLAALEAAAIQPDIIMPDVLAVPIEDGRWSVFHEGAKTLVRTGPQSGFSVDTDNLAAMLRAALDDPNVVKPQSLHLFSCAGPQAEPPELAIAGLGIEVETKLCEPDSLRTLVGHYQEQQAINLLQGAYSRTEQWQKLWRPWRPAAAILALLLVVNLGVRIVDYWEKDHDYQALRDEINALYLATFPAERTVLDARKQMTAHLEQLRGAAEADGGGGMLSLLSGIGPQVQGTEGLELKRLSYKDGTLDLAVGIGDLQRLEALKQKLEEGGELSAVILSATARDGVVDARLQIKAAGT